MAKKPKFEWEFVVDEDERDLTINLNGDVSKILIIENPAFYENVAKMFTEINLFQFVHDTKTEITPSSFTDLNKAYAIHEAYKKTDRKMEKLWSELADVPFNEIEGEMVLAEEWNRFARGTYREEIWHWFDKQHSKGVAWLMHKESGIR